MATDKDLTDKSPSELWTIIEDLQDDIKRLKVACHASNHEIVRLREALQGILVLAKPLCHSSQADTAIYLVADKALKGSEA
jgi:hypothetical protein